MTTIAPHYLPDAEVTAELDGALRALLSRCFTDPCFAHQRFCHEMPQHRWIILAENGEPAAHLAAHDKFIGAFTGDLRVFAVAEVCVHPDFRGRGLVRDLIAAAHAWARAQEFPWAMLFGEPAVYASSGYLKISNPIRRFSPRRSAWEASPMASAMTCPLSDAPAWPQGEIDLRGPLF